jgi:hypothetical protein
MMRRLTPLASRTRARRTVCAADHKLVIRLGERRGLAHGDRALGVTTLARQSVRYIDKEIAMEIYTYRIGIFAPSDTGGETQRKLPDVTGYDVEASDGHIGKIDEATYEESSSCLIVDTGFWIFGKKRMIPAGVVQGVDAEAKKVFVDMTKEQIKNAPDYDADRHAAD